MPDLVFYDGDGGGLCGHLRHRFELYLLAGVSGANIVDIYPYTRLLSVRVRSDLDRDSVKNAILLSELSSGANTFEEIADRVANYRDHYILSGRHHYSQLFRKYIRGIPPMRLITLYREMFKLMGFSATNIHRLANIYSQHRRDMTGTTPRLAIHLRTLVDSPIGYQQFRERRASVYGWISLQLRKYYNSLQPNTVYIASDNSSDMQRLLSLVSHYGFSGIQGARFTHTSLANAYGFDLLARTNDLAYQRDICIRQSNHNVLDWDALRELITLSAASAIIATDSTFSQMAFVLGECTSYECYGFDSYGLDAFCL